MLHVGQHDVVAGLQLERVGGEVEAVGRVLRECDLGGLGAEELRQHRARLGDVHR
jgi:hypothetical protein